MVYRVYVEKKEGLRQEAASLLRDIREFLGVASLEGLRVVNRYDVEGLSEEDFRKSCAVVLSEPQLDDVHERLYVPEEGSVFAVEYLPGQFDQRADSAAQCIQILTQKERPGIRTARVYVLEGKLSEEDLTRIKKYVINPVEAREASLAPFETLRETYPVPGKVEVLEGFTELSEDTAAQFVKSRGLAMDAADLLFCRDYFRDTERRNPTLTELRMIDTYWSDHCRHTTFLTELGDVSLEDPLAEAEYKEYLKLREETGDKKPVCLMDIATIGAKALKKRGLLPKLDESDEINACTVKITANVDGEAQDWLLLFKNETHNHPTEIEPFGGAATCIGGAIRDPLSGRSYVYAAMRVTGAADPTVPVSETLPGKLPQRKLVTGAAQGYSSYGNQIGLATGIVDEVYHPGYAAKHMEIGAVLGAAPASNVRRETPAPGDLVVLLGGRTGRDGIGGATGSSKAHDAHSVENCGAEVQKGNAPEERKLQRLFRNPEATRLIKRCNDFGAGGVSVAVGELADGLRIDLSAVPKKYEGLDGTELAISESQERMAVVIAPSDRERFLELADSENLEATVIAEVTAEPRLVMSWNGDTIVNISREFLNTNGASRRTDVRVKAPKTASETADGTFAERLLKLAGDLNVCSKRGLAERFDSTIGAASLLMPFGGKQQLTPIQAMVHRLPVDGRTDTCSFMAWGYNPVLTEQSPFRGAYLAVVESVSKLIAAGASFEDVYLTFQEYFPRPGTDPARWGQPLAALLGALKAQRELGIAAIGGKDSMSGSFEDLDVPPTLVSFAVTTGSDADVISGEFKAPGHTVCWLKPEYKDGLPTAESLLTVFNRVTALVREGRAAAVYTPGFGGAAEAVMKMCLGNTVGFAFDGAVEQDALFGHAYGSFIVELGYGEPVGEVLGCTLTEKHVRRLGGTVSLAELLEVYEGRLESVYPTSVLSPGVAPKYDFVAVSRPAPRVKCAKPTVLIPVFPGTNCEYDTVRAFERAGAQVETFVVRNRTADAIARSVEEFARLMDRSQIVFIPGGFSGGDEPDGSGKFITAFFRNAAVKDAVTRLLADRDGLMGGICNGFQALVKLGLVPYGQIVDADVNAPTLTFNTIGRHQSRIVRTRVCSNKSPWLAATKPGEIYSVPVSHGEGRFLAYQKTMAALVEKGQIATQYVDFAGNPTMDIRHNPNGAFYAVEGITSPDGRILGKMGHSERTGGLYRNVPGEYDMKLFESAVRYFR